MKPRPACSKNHLLSFTCYSRSFADKFRCATCDVPGFVSSGRWTCAACSLDFCRKCRPPPIPAKLPGTSCPQGHPLLFSSKSTGYRSAAYACDACEKGPYPTSSGRNCCLECKYDLCPKCSPRSDRLHITHCALMHPLTLGKSVGSDCQLCGRHIVPAEAEWACYYCNYAVCRRCRPATQNPCRCPAGHPLKLSPSSARSYVCESCGHVADPVASSRWTCGICEFYSVCAECIGGDKQPSLRCGKGHSLSVSYSRKGYTGDSFICDVCGKPGKCSTGRWACEKCQYDVCGMCRPVPQAEKKTLPRFTIKAKTAQVRIEEVWLAGGTLLVICSRLDSAQEKNREAAVEVSVPEGQRFVPKFYIVGETHGEKLEGFACIGGADELHAVLKSGFRLHIYPSQSLK